MSAQRQHSTRETRHLHIMPTSEANVIPMLWPESATDWKREYEAERKLREIAESKTESMERQRDAAYADSARLMIALTVLVCAAAAVIAVVMK